MEIYRYGKGLDFSSRHEKDNRGPKEANIMTDLCVVGLFPPNYSGYYINNRVEEDKSWKGVDQ